MEIIDELEPTKRGLYGGTVGYLGFDGNIDTCIAIRTVLFKNDRAYVQAGGGIVADSVPEKEFEESENKARAVISAIEAGVQSFADKAGRSAMILIIDNYDSFTYNLYQYIGKFYQDILVVRNDEITLEEIEMLAPQAIVISPGPRLSGQAPVFPWLRFRSSAGPFPILGVCLGHQSIGEAFGGKTVHAKHTDARQSQ